MSDAKVKSLSSTLVYSGKIFDLVEEKLEFPDGKVHVHAQVKHPGAVVVLPEISKGEFLMVYQYRAVIGRTLFEFPAGTLKKSEDPLVCAKRELEEETGHRAAEWIDLGILYPAPGFCSEKQHLYLARDLTESALNLDEDEILEAKRVTLAQIESMISDGMLCDGKSLALFARARMRDLI